MSFLGFGGGGNTVTVRVVGDASKLNQELRKAKGDTDRFSQDAGRSVRGFSTGVQAALIAGAGAAVVGFVGDAIGSFSDLEQAIGGTEAVFGDASGAIEDFAQESAEAIGLSEAEFRTATTSIGGQLKRMTGDVDLAAEQSVTLTEVAADLAATYGGTTVEAVRALGAAFRGEADPAERFNLDLKVSRVNAKAVELGLVDAEGKVTDYGKAQATVALIMEQSTDAQGQFARELDSVAGSAQVAAAKFEDFKASAGEAFAPAAVEGLEGAQDLLDFFETQREIDRQLRETPDDNPLVGFLKAIRLGTEGVVEARIAQIDADKAAALSSTEAGQAMSDASDEGFLLRQQLDGVSESADGATLSSEVLAAVEEDLAENTEAARQALRRKQQTLQEIHNPMFRAVRLNKELAEAQEAVDEAADPEEFKAATIARAEVLAELKATLLELKEDGIDPTGAAAQAMLRELGIPDDVIASIFADIDTIRDQVESVNPRMTIEMFVPELGTTSSGSVVKVGTNRFVGHDGGVIPGLPGQEVNLKALAGETILPTHDPAKMNGVGGSTSTTVINVSSMLGMERIWREMQEEARRQ